MPSNGSFPDTLIIRRPSGTDVAPGGTVDIGDGTWDDDDNDPTNDTSLVCKTRCDAQDKPVVLRRDASGAPVAMADVQVFLLIERVIELVLLGDLVDLTYKSGATEILTVAQIRRLDGSLLLQRGG